MTQWAEVLDAEPEDLSLILRTHRVEGLTC